MNTLMQLVIGLPLMFLMLAFFGWAFITGSREDDEALEREADEFIESLNKYRKSDNLGSDQDDGKYEADWDEKRGKYR